MKLNKNNMKRRFYWLLAKSRVIRSLFYGFSKYYQHQFLISARGRYKNAKETQHGLIAMGDLRRNIHRIEKGLISRPLRTEFATSYIHCTVQTYCKSILDERTADWARSVLTEYYEKTTSNNSNYLEAKAMFSAHTTDQLANEKPFLHSPKADFQTFTELAKYRRSVRYFSSGLVSWDIIEEAISCALYAPSACNRTPAVYHVIQGGSVSGILSTAGGAEGYRDTCENVAVICGRTELYSSEIDRNNVFTDVSMGIQNFILSLTSSGIGTVCINWKQGKSQEARLRSLVPIEDPHMVVMLVAFGNFDTQLVPFSSRAETKKHIRMQS